MENFRENRTLFGRTAKPEKERFSSEFRVMLLPSLQDNAGGRGAVAEPGRHWSLVE
jgi:hypothetical protein